MKDVENTDVPNMIVDEVFPKRITQRENFAEIREAVRKYRITEPYLAQDKAVEDALGRLDEVVNNEM